MDIRNISFGYVRILFWDNKRMSLVYLFISSCYSLTHTDFYLFIPNRQVLAAGLSRTGDGAAGQVGTRRRSVTAVTTPASGPAAATTQARLRARRSGTPRPPPRRPVQQLLLRQRRRVAVDCCGGRVMTANGRERGRLEGRRVLKLGSMGCSKHSIPTGLSVIKSRFHFGVARDAAMKSDAAMKG